MQPRKKLTPRKSNRFITPLVLLINVDTFNIINMDETWLDIQAKNIMMPKGRGVKYPVKDKRKDQVSERGVKQPV